MLQEADNPEEKLQYVTIIEENNKRLLQLISDILDLSKIEAGTFDFTFEKVNAKRLCNELYQAMQMRTSPQVELRLSPDLPDLQLTSDKMCIRDRGRYGLEQTEEASISLTRKRGNFPYWNTSPEEITIHFLPIRSYVFITTGIIICGQAASETD